MSILRVGHHGHGGFRRLLRLSLGCMGVRVKFKVLRDRERVSRGKDAGARGNPRFPNGRRGRTHGRPFERFDLTEVTAESVPQRVQTATARAACVFRVREVAFIYITDVHKFS